MEIDDDHLLAPDNFSMVEEGVYRSAFPRTKHSKFIRNLNLKSVVPLVPEGYPEAMSSFYEKCNIQLLPHGLDGNKWPFKEINILDFRRIMHLILDPTNRPLLIHCNKGKHRTGCVVACLRKIRGWSLSAIFAEYLMFADPKARTEDQRFIEVFELEDDTRDEEECKQDCSR